MSSGGTEKERSDMKWVKNMTNFTWTLFKPTFTSSKLTIESLEQDLKYVYC